MRYVHLSIYKIYTASPPPVGGPTLQESSHRTKIALVSQEIGLLGLFTPELDCVGQRVDGLLMPSDERASKVNSLQIVLLGLKIGDLANVVTASPSVRSLPSTITDSITHLMA